MVFKMLVVYILSGFSNSYREMLFCGAGTLNTNIGERWKKIWKGMWILGFGFWSFVDQKQLLTASDLLEKENREQGKQNTYRKINK